VTFDIGNLPAGTVFAWTLLDLAPSEPAIQLPTGFGILAPGCRLSTSISPLLLPWESSAPFPATGSTYVGTRVLNVPHGWEGQVFTAQAVGILGATWLVPWTSNAIKFTAGLQ
jgi:hypothetical protein